MYFIQFSMTQDERKGLILCLKIEFSDGLWGVTTLAYGGVGVVIHKNAVIWRNCVIESNVTIGGRNDRGI